MLDTESRAKSIYRWRAAPSGGACPSCVVVLQRRLRHGASDLPSEQRTRWDQMLQHAARTVRGCEPHQPYSVTRPGRWQRPRSRSGGKRKPSDQAGRRALDGKTRGATLIEQDGVTRTTGSALGQGRAGARAGREVREASGRDRDAPPGEPGHHAQQRLPRWPGRTAARPDGGGTPHGTRPRAETERVRRRRTNTSARLRGDTVQKKTEGTARERRERAQGSRRELGFRVQRVGKGRKSFLERKGTQTCPPVV